MKLVFLLLSSYLTTLFFLHLNEYLADLKVPTDMCSHIRIKGRLSDNEAK